MRDALSILDQVISFAGEKIEFENITKVLGLIPYDLFFDLTKSIKEKHAESLVDVLNKIRSLGTPLEDVVNGLNQHLRNLLIGTVVGAESSLEVNPELQERYAAEAKHWERRDLMRFSQVFSKLEPEIRRAAQPQILLEMNLLKMLEMDQSVTIEEILNSKPQSSAAPKPVQYEIPEVVEKKPPSVSSEKKTSQTKVEAQAAQTKKGKVTPENQNDESAILDLETIKSNWHKMITKISSIKTSVAMVLEHTLPMELNNKKLDVAVVDQPRFSLDRLERNRQLIENTFKEIFKQSMRITFLFNEEIEEDIKHEIPDAPGIPTKGDPVVNRVIEVFDGEILR